MKPSTRIRSLFAASLMLCMPLGSCGGEATVVEAKAASTVTATDALDAAEPLANAPDVIDAVEPEAADPSAVVSHALVVDRGDLPDMLAKGRVRVLVPYEHPFFFIENGRPRGAIYEAFREYGRFLEEQQGLRTEDITIVYVPCQLEVVPEWLKAGYGDIAASALTVTPEREAQVSFTDSLVTNVEEIVVSSSSAPGLQHVTDLAGRDVHVTAGSSYAEHLRTLNRELETLGEPPIQIHEVHTLSTEDLLEMVHAGIFELTVCDGYKAELWAEVLTEITPRRDLVVHAGGELAWAVRRESPELLANLNEFVGQARKGTLLGNILIKRYFKSTRWIEDPGDPESAERLERYAVWIQELAAEYDFDWLRVAAQCFQESGLDPQAKSSAGAIGLMQLLPSTAKDMGCDDPYDPQANLRAGVRYLDWLRTNFFADPELDELERMDFILAAYNAGPGNVRKWRGLAQGRGLDPNVWHDNVERLARESVGVQPIRYVDNIEKYYVAYSLAYDLQTRRQGDQGENG